MVSSVLEKKTNAANYLARGKKMARTLVALAVLLLAIGFVMWQRRRPALSQVSFPDPPSVIEEYRIPEEYTLPSISTEIPQVSTKPHRWSASSVWRKHRNKIVGGLAVGTIAVAGGIAKRNQIARARQVHNLKEREWHRGLRQVESELAYEETKAEIMDQLRIMAQQARERADGYTEELEQENALFDEYDDDMNQQEQSRTSIRNFKKSSRELLDNW